MKRIPQIALCFLFLHAVLARADAATAAKIPTASEEQREIELRNRLCAARNLNCEYVKSIFADPRLTIYPPPESTPPPAPSSTTPRVRERNPYLTERFGLLTLESLERCRNFIQAHPATFDAAEKIYGVPKEVICGHLRIETDFGIPTRLSPHPVGTLPAVNRLVSLYVRKPVLARSQSRFAKRQIFALGELRNLFAAADTNGWDLFAIPGSSTGAIGLVQFEPSSFHVAVDGDGDGKIDLFDPDDAILSVANYLVTRGWDRNPDHQKRAVYAYYGGHYDQDPYKYYMKAVLQYADGVRSYLQDHPLQADLTLVIEPPAPQDAASAPSLPGSN
jgi:membrane-bound lytic murein transglycosylase B